MNLRAVIRVLGMLLMASAIAMVVPALVSAGYGEDDWRWFGLCTVLGSGIGGLVAWTVRAQPELRPRDGFLIVSLGWLMIGLFGALPFWFSGAIPSFTDAAFESISGFTTTGASILTDIEALAHGPALWRCMIQWLGGMGIVVLSIAILPILGVGGMQLFRAEAPGPSPDRLTPRIQETARLLWGVYCAFTALQVIALAACGLSWFDALCHAFTTMSSGGFSTQNASVGQFQNPAVEYVVMFFMAAAGVNFSLHFAALRGRSPAAYFRDSEFKVYTTVILVAAAMLMLTNLSAGLLHGEENVRASLFQTLSILTTTGYGTADYETWTSAAQFVLVLLMFIGGCAGSTAGGMKNVRILLLTRHGLNELRKLVHPHGIYVIRFNRKPVDPSIVTNVLGFFLLMMIVTIGATLVMTLFGLDLVSAFGAVAASVNNIGPGLGDVGPTDNYGGLPALAKWLLALLMLLGRLELFTVLVLFTPDFWRRA